MHPSVWGPPYWFVFHSMAMNYPIHPTNMEKRNMYKFIENIPEFIPKVSMSKTFRLILKENPVIPYLDTRMDLVKWMHHIHNEMNVRIGKPPMSLADHLYEYDRLSDPPPQKLVRLWQKNHQIVYTTMIMLIFMYTYMKTYSK
jgi:hypothetical protein